MPRKRPTVDPDSQAAGPMVPRPAAHRARHYRAVTDTAAVVRAAPPRHSSRATSGRRRSGAAVAVVGIIVGVVAGATHQSSAQPVPASAMVNADTQLFALTNQDRASNGVPALQWYTPLSTIAEAGQYNGCGFPVSGRAYDMIQRNYFAHAILNCGQNVFAIMNANGIPYRSAAENIGWTTQPGEAQSVAAIDSSFMNSAEHRASILNPNYTHVGMGSANSGAGFWSGGTGPSYQNVSMYAEEFAQLVPGSVPPTPLPVSSPPVVAAGRGAWDVPYSLENGSFRSLGGGTLAAPAVVDVGGTLGVLYIVTGTDHALWVRGDTSGWIPLSQASTYCIDNPAASAADGVLTVACEGSDHQLYAAQTALPAAGLPQVGAFTGLGGYLTAGPAVANVNGEPTFLVDGIGSSRVYSRTLGTGFTPTPWSCIGHPGLASSGSVTYFGCHGTDNALWTAYNTGGGWSGTQSAGGTLIDGIGVAASPSGAVYWVEGTDSGLYDTTVPLGQAAQGFIGHGGSIRNGAGAGGY